MEATTADIWRNFSMPASMFLKHTNPLSIYWNKYGWFHYIGMTKRLPTLSQLEKNGSTSIVFVSLEILKSNSTFETKNQFTFFRAISTFVFGECYLRQQMNFNRAQKVHIYLSAFLNTSICMNAHL